MLTTSAGESLDADHVCRRVVDELGGGLILVFVSIIHYVDDRAGIPMVARPTLHRDHDWLRE
jgi:hypothetical protein